MTIKFDDLDSDSEDGEGLWPVQHQLPNLLSVTTASLSVPTTTATPILYDTSSDSIMQSVDPSSNPTTPSLGISFPAIS
jgi:hypothetical protein